MKTTVNLCFKSENQWKPLINYALNPETSKNHMELMLGNQWKPLETYALNPEIKETYALSPETSENHW